MRKIDRCRIYLAIDELYQEKGISVSLLCKFANICKQAYYKWKTKKIKQLKSFRI
ncbi:hypothetical protein [Cetobacterium sp.]|uniref:hypothetical protein n=1 Tax=Cetobacterium sp. TaxID=2071632 RepID=UPI003EE665D4